MVFISLYIKTFELENCKISVFCSYPAGKKKAPN